MPERSIDPLRRQGIPESIIKGSHQGFREDAVDAHALPRAACD
jgi:hypothetical protein